VNRAISRDGKLVKYVPRLKAQQTSYVYVQASFIMMDFARTIYGRRPLVDILAPQQYAFTLSTHHSACRFGV
jgi:hypothetical protein